MRAKETRSNLDSFVASNFVHRRLALARLRLESGAGASFPECPHDDQVEQQNDIAGAVMSAETLPAVVMPARDKFVPDDRRGGPEVR